MNCKSIMSLMAVAAFAVATSASAGSWSTQATLASSAYQGTVGLDAAGNMTSVWFQYNAPNGSAIDEIWASSAAFGQPWSAPVDVSGNLGPSQNNPGVRVSAAGNATAVYTSQTLGTVYNDKPAGGSWGTTHATNGANQFYVSNDGGVEGMASSTGGARPTSSTIVGQVRPAGGTWSTPATLAAAPHLSLDGATVTPDGTMAVAWESFDSTCTSRVCKTSNWVLHVSTRAPGAQNWVDSGGILGPDATQHFGQLAGDSVGDLGVIALQAGNVVSKVRHGSAWSSTAIVVSASGFQFYTGTGRDNRIFYSDSAGHATLVGWGDIHLQTLAGIDGNLTNNTWGAPATITGADQFPNYFDFAESSSGASIVFYSLVDLTGTGNTVWRAVTRAGGKPWNAPATAGHSFEGGGTPPGVAINAAGQAAVVFQGLTSDYLTNVLYTNTYKP